LITYTSTRLQEESGNTWASLTLIILFSEMLKFPPKIKIKIFFLNENKESDEIFRNISFVNMELSK